MRSYHFLIYHIPTGQKIVKTIENMSESQFYELLAQWNKNGIGIWQYAPWHKEDV